MLSAKKHFCIFTELKKETKYGLPQKKNKPILDDIGQGASPEKTDDQKPKPKQVNEEKKSKPKLKSIRQKEAEETPLEKLKRLETGEKLRKHVK